MSKSVKIVIAIILVIVIGMTIYLIFKPDKTDTRNTAGVNDELELKVEPDGEPEQNFLNNLKDMNKDLENVI